MTREELQIQIRAAIFSVALTDKAYFYVTEDDKKQVIEFHWVEPSSLTKEGNELLQRWEGYPTVKIPKARIIEIEVDPKEIACVKANQK